MKTKSTILKFAATAMALACIAAHAQDYPSKLIRIVVPYPPGGGLDTTARLIGKKMSEQMGQPIIVENKPGAGGSIGTAMVAKAEPDGYTLLLGNPGPNAINPSVYPATPYDVIKDFAPVSLVTTLPVLFCVRSQSPYQTINQVVNDAKTPGKNINFGSTGNGSLTHLIGQNLVSLTQSNMTHVPYKGASPLVTAILGGEIEIGLLSGVDAAPMVSSNRMRCLANAAKKRDSIFPESPTISESGVANMDISIWYGLLAPAKTPKPIIERINKEVAKALADPGVSQQLKKLSSTPAPSTPEAFGKLIADDYARYAQIVKTAGVKVE